MGFSGFDFSDLFTQPGTGGRSRASGEAGGAGAFRDLFSQFFGRSAQTQHTAEPQKGTDLEYVLNIGFWQAIRGTQAKLSITRQDVCPTCQGTGTAAAGTTSCPQCDGTGSVTQMAGAMRFNPTRPRCGGSGVLQNASPTWHGDAPV